MILLVLVLVLQLISPVVDGKLLEINIHGLGKSGQDARTLSFDTTHGNAKDAVQRSVVNTSIGHVDWVALYERLVPLN